MININKIIQEEIDSILLESLSVEDTAFKTAIAQVESNNNYKADNPNSTAIGKYQFIWSIHSPYIKQLTGVDSADNFMNDSSAQEKYMQHWIDSTLKPTAEKLKKNTNKFTDPELMALVHYQGAKGAENYISAGEQLAPNINQPIPQYLGKFTKAYGSSEILKQTIDQESENLSDEDQEQLIDKIQFVLDFAGFLPIIGDAIDAINGVIYFARGLYIDGILSMVAIIPGLGSAIATPLRVMFRGLKKVIKPDILAKAFKTGDMRTVLAKAMQHDLIDAKTLETLAANGDKVADMLVKLDKVNAKYIKSDLVSKGSSRARKIFQSLIDSSKKNSVDVAFKSSSKLSAATSKVFKKLVDNKIVKTVSNLSGLRKAGKSQIPELTKALDNQFTTRLLKQPDAIIAMLNRAPDRGLALNLLKRAGYSGDLTAAAKMPWIQLTPLVKKELQAASTNTAAKKNLFNYLNSADNKLVNGMKPYKEAYIQKELANFTNRAVTKHTLFRFAFKNEHWLSNINVFKIGSKLLYVAYALEDSSYDSLQWIAKGLFKLADKLYTLTGLYALGSDVSPEDESEIRQLESQISAEMQKVNELIYGVMEDTEIDSAELQPLKYLAL